MTKADLVEQVAEAIGPGITKKDCALVVDGFLNAVKAALAEGREHRDSGVRDLQGPQAQDAHGPEPSDG